MMDFRKFTKSGYFRLFLVAFGMEVGLGVLGLIWPKEVWPQPLVPRPPVFQWFMGATFVLAILTMIIGGGLVIYNPQLNRNPDPPMSLNLDGLTPSDAKSEAGPDAQERWPDWRPVVACILVLGGVIFAYAIAAN